MSDIKLSKDTLETLDKVYNVNQTLKFVEGERTLKVVNADGDILVHAPIQESIPRDFHVYDLRELNSVLSIISEPVLDFSNDDHLIIRSDDGKQVVHYAESEPEFVTSYTDAEPDIGDTQVNVMVTKEQFQTVMKARSAMKLGYVGFISDGETVNLVTFDRQNEDDDEFANKFSVELDEAEDKFELFFELETSDISVLSGEGDLNFYLGADRKIAKVETSVGRTFWIAMHVKSWYGEDDGDE